jgi:hypothetical protein
MNITLGKSQALKSNEIDFDALPLARDQRWMYQNRNAVMVAQKDGWIHGKR